MPVIGARSFNTKLECIVSISEHSCLLVWTINGKQFALQYKTETAVRQWPTAAQHLDYVDHVFDVLNLPHWYKIVVCLYQSQLNKQLYIIYLEGSAFMYWNNAFLSRHRSVRYLHHWLQSHGVPHFYRVSTSPCCTEMSLFVTGGKKITLFLGSGIYVICLAHNVP